MRRCLPLAALALLAAALPALAQPAPTRLRFNNGWRIEAPAASYLLAIERGYFAREGLEVTVDAGNGSTGAVTAVAGGAYDLASADFASEIAPTRTGCSIEGRAGGRATPSPISTARTTTR